jgi:alkanesulfonate monooxygenase SsuD/methylene tetrahydromethanopterin reductase-like flavin-dependent oxidoreductase (luciferase family)
VILSRAVGLGLASRGDVREAVDYAGRARSAGLTSVWLHESYFERDAVTYAAAIAAGVDDVGIGLGALSTYARPTALTAMTVSALDDLAPGRISVALGSALPRDHDHRPSTALAGRAAAVGHRGLPGTGTDVRTATSGAGVGSRVSTGVPRAGRPNR